MNFQEAQRAAAQAVEAKNEEKAMIIFSYGQKLVRDGTLSKLKRNHFTMADAVLDYQDRENCCGSVSAICLDDENTRAIATKVIAKFQEWGVQASYHPVKGIVLKFD